MTDRTIHDDARSTERVRNWLAFLLVGAFVSALPLFVFVVIPDGNRDIITYMVGQLSGMATTALGLYFLNKAGQDSIDATRAETTGKAFDAVTALSANANGGTDASIIRDGDPVTVTKTEEQRDALD